MCEFKCSKQVGKRTIVGDRVSYSRHVGLYVFFINEVDFMDDHVYVLYCT